MNRILYYLLSTTSMAESVKNILHTLCARQLQGTPDTADTRNPRRVARPTRGTRSSRLHHASIYSCRIRETGAVESLAQTREALLEGNLREIPRRTFAPARWVERPA